MDILLMDEVVKHKFAAKGMEIVHPPKYDAA